MKGGNAMIQNASAGGKMRVDLCVYTGLREVNAKSFFIKSFYVSSALLRPGTIIPPGGFSSNLGRLRQGVVTDVSGNGKATRVWVWTESHEADLRDCLLPDGWQEVTSN